jgi:copper transport protein
VSRTTRRTGRVLLGGVAVLALLLVTSGTASAHARLVATEPAASSVLLTSPARVVIHFDDIVTVDPGSLRVFGPGGRRVDEGNASQPAGDSHAVVVGLVPVLGRGSYVVAWRVVSDDGHPVHGAYVFSVGSDRGAARASVLAGALATESGAPGVGAVAGVLRWAGLAGLLTLVGLSLLVAVVSPGDRATRRVRRILWAALALAFGATVAGIAVEGAYGALLPLGDVLRPSLVAEVLRTRFGRADALRAILLVAFVPVLLYAWRGGVDVVRPRRWVPVGVVALGSGLLAATALAGHAVTGTAPTVGLVLDIAHLAGASVWVGGLVLLAAILVRPTADSRPDRPAALTRTVSAWLLVAAAAVVVSGTAQAFRQVGSRYALFHTPYGRTLIVKVLLVLLLLGLGAVSRRLVHGSWGLRRRPATADAGATPVPDPAGRLARTVAMELALVLTVVGVTAALVNDVPARQAAGLPFTVSVTTVGVQVNAIVDPARAGIGNEIHVYLLSPAGTPEAVLSLDAVLRLPASGVGLVRVPLQLSGPGHYYATDVVLPVAGTWTLSFTVRTASGRAGSAQVLLPVH